MKQKPTTILLIFLTILLVSCVGVGAMHARYLTSFGTQYFSLDVDANYYATFDPNGGEITSPEEPGGEWIRVSTASAVKKVEVGKKYGELPEAERTGYTFDSWGEFPKGYEEVEYIKSTGQEYINTGYHPYQSTFGYIIDFIFYDNLSGTRSIMSVYDSWSSGYACFGLGGNWHAKCSHCPGWQANVEPIGDCLEPGKRGTISIINNGDYNPTTGVSTYKVDSPLIKGNYEAHGNKTVNMALPIFSGGNGTSYVERAAAQIYSLKILEVDTPVMDFVPAVWTGGETRYSQNGQTRDGYLQADTPGLLDMCSKVFYINSGEGQLIAGPRVHTRSKSISPETEVSNSADHTIFAVWQANKYILTLYPEDGSETTDVQVTYDKTYEQLPELKRKGYTFNGWYDAREGGNKFERNATVKITSNMSLYAHWTPNTYTVTFDAKGGSVTPDTKQVTFDEKYGTLPVPERSGYDFLGWKATDIPSGFTQVECIKADGHNQYINTGYKPKRNSYGFSIDYTFYDSPGTTVTMMGTHDNWSVTTTSCFSLGGNYLGYYGSHNQSWMSGIDNAVKKSYVTPGVRGTVSILNNGDYDQATGTSTITIKSSLRPNETETETVTGDNEANNSLIVFGTNGEGNIREHPKADVYRLQIFEVNTLKFDFIPAVWKGGVTKYSKNAVTMEGELPEGTAGLYDRVSKTFYISSVTTGFVAGDPVTDSILVDEDTTVSIATDHTLYAEWKPSEYIVTFNPQGGNVSQATKSVTYKEAYGELPVPEKTGNTFLGWSTFPDGFTEVEYLQSHGTEYINTGEIPDVDCGILADLQYTSNKNDSCAFGVWWTSNFSLVYTWYSGRWYFGTGLGAESNNTGDDVLLRQTVDINYNTPNAVMQNGNKLGNYTSGHRGNVPMLIFERYLDGNLNNKKSSIKLYSFKMKNGGEIVRDFVPAVWNGGVTKYSQGGVATEGELAKNTAGLYDMVTKVFYINSGSGTFEYGNPTSTVGEIINENTIVTKTEDHTLNAQWQINTYLITLNYGDERTPEYLTVTYGETFKNLPEAKRDGYVFQGWYDAETGGNLFPPERIVDITSDMNLYAHWEPMHYTVTLDANGGTVSPATMSVVYGEKYGDIPEPVLSGYKLKTWKTDTFAAGYQRVEYLQSHGTEFIHTGEIVGTDCGVMTELQYTSNKNECCAFGAWSSGVSNLVFTWFASAWYFGIGNGTENHATGAEVLSRQTIDINFDTPGAVMQNGTKLGDYHTGHTANYPMLIFDRYVNGKREGKTSSIKLYSFKMKNDGIITRDFVPAVWNGGVTKYSQNGVVTEGELAENTAGLYDMVTKVFYINSGTGTFEIGGKKEEKSLVINNDSIVEVAEDHTLVAEWEPALALTLKSNYEGGGEQIISTK